MNEDTLTWARARALFGGTSVNALIRQFLDEYAAVPDRWRQGLPPPWTPEGKIREVMDPVGAGPHAAGTAAELAEEAIWEGSLARQG